MKTFRADLHIHTVLSPCGDLEMSPDVIVARALEMKLDIIGITDHNTTRQCRVTRKLGEKAGIAVLMGAEVTTKEEVHCLTFFETLEQLDDFQAYLDHHIPDIRNDVKRFGYQVAVDEHNDIVYTEERLLISALDEGIGQVEAKVHSLGGLFIPAHIDKPRFSLYGQLGFMPAGLQVDALEISPKTSPAQFLLLHPELRGIPLISSSDAHLPALIGTRVTCFEMEHPGFGELRKTILEKGRKNPKIIN